MCKKLICTLALLIAFITPLNITAAEEVSFSLTDVTTGKSRLFETTLSVSGDVAAFVASLTFDETALEFRTAKALCADAQISTNSSEKGKVKIAYLCENGATDELITLTFKSNEQSSYIDLNVEQVIDKNANDISVTNLKGAEILVTDKLSQGNNKTDNQNDKEQTDTNESKTESTANRGTSYIEIPSEQGNNKALIICTIGGVILICAVAAVAFFLGRSSAENKNSRKN